MIDVDVVPWYISYKAVVTFALIGVNYLWIPISNIQRNKKKKIIVTTTRNLILYFADTF